MPTAIRIHQLCKSFDSLKALDAVSFEVKDAAFFGLLGPNGAGKTTLIKALTGLANLNSGSISVYGQDVVKNYRQARALIGLCPQEFNFDPYLSIEKILTYEGGFFGIPIRESRKKAVQMLDRFGLIDKRKDCVRKLSGGMKRRLLIARALMHDPKILILDEPTAGVDLELRYRLWQLLKDLNAEGRTIFLTTHYLEEAERLCEQIAVIDKGRLIALDHKDKLIADLGDSAIEIELDKDIPSSFDPSRAWSLRQEGPRKIVMNPRLVDLNDVIKSLIEQDIKIVDVLRKQKNLEDVFVQLTGMNMEFQDTENAE